MWKQTLGRFARDAKGGIALMFGLLVPSVIGFTGLGIDGTAWLMSRSKLQATSDGAAISAAHALRLDGDKAPLGYEAGRAFARAYGSAYTAIRYNVEHPPTSGAFAGNKNVVAVVAERDQPAYFLRYFGMNQVTIASRAAARIDQTADACMLALSKNSDKALEFTGSSLVSLGCGLASNSTSSTAVYLGGSTTVTASGVSTAGDIYQGGSADVVTDGPMRTHSGEVDDPYGPTGRNLQAPASPKNCTEKKLRVMANKALSPGRYCSGLDIQKGTATLSPGVYIIDGGTLSVGAQASLVGNDVTIILTGSGTDYAGLDVNGNANISLHAPSSGTAYDGVVMFQDPNAPTFKGNKVIVNKLNGGADLSLTGAVYFPKQGLDFRGGANATVHCLQLVGYTVSVSGNSAISSTCDKATNGTERITRVQVELVE